MRSQAPFAADSWALTLRAPRTANLSRPRDCVVHMPWVRLVSMEQISIPEAGWILQSPYNAVSTMLIGDSIQSLLKLPRQH
jgi:hypothetical protein